MCRCAGASGICNLTSYTSSAEHTWGNVRRRDLTIFLFIFNYNFTTCLCQGLLNVPVFAWTRRFVCSSFLPTEIHYAHVHHYDVCTPVSTVAALSFCCSDAPHAFHMFQQCSHIHDSCVSTQFSHFSLLAQFQSWGRSVCTWRNSCHIEAVSGIILLVLSSVGFIMFKQGLD